MTLYMQRLNYLNFQVINLCLDLAFSEICTFSIDFSTGPNTIESLSKLLKQSPLKTCCGPAALLKRDSGAVVSFNFREIFQNTCFKERPCT